MGVTKSIDGGEPNTFADAYKKAGVYKVTDVQLPNLKQADIRSYFDAEPKILSLDDILNMTKKSSEVRGYDICAVKNRNNPSYINVNDSHNKDVIATLDCGHGHDHNSKLLVDAGTTEPWWYQIPYDVTPKKEPIEEDKFRITSDKKVKLFYNK